MSDLLQRLKALPGGPQTVVVPTAQGSVEVAASQVDRVGMELERLRVANPTSTEPLGDRAERIAGSARGLLEDLRVYEVDGSIDRAILRSDAPAVEGDVAHYYEVQLAPGSAELTRQRADRTQVGHREAVPFTLTHEALARLAEQLG